MTMLRCVQFVVLQAASRVVIALTSQAMLSKLILNSVFLFTSTALAAAVQGSGSQTSQLVPIDPLLPTLSNPLSPSNQSTWSLNATTLDEGFNIKCDGSKYGVNLDLADCEGALKSFQRGLNRITFAERGPGFPPGVFPLPYRWMGGL